MTRKLAAILAVDVAEFSRIMQTDEEGALATLRGHRAAAEARVGVHGGRIFGGAGDSLFAEFPSVLAAVACAREIQTEIAERNRELPGHLRMQFRIGVHVGDVMIERDNLYGTGVNVAERLQGLTPPGEIALSEAAYLHVAAQPELTFEPFGEHRVKHIREPLRVYLLRSAGQAPPTTGAARRGMAAGLATLLLGAAILVAWHQLQTTPPDGGSPAFPELASPQRHFSVENPARLDDAAALTIYERIQDRMAAGYSQSEIDVAARYTSWRRYNTVPYLSAQHGGRYLNNFANARASAYGAYDDLDEMPPGAVIAKDSFEVTQRGDVLSGPLFVMEKMPSGFSSETGDWRYTMILPDGQVVGRTKGRHSERVRFCARCHARAADLDQLFGIPPAYRREFLGTPKAGAPEG